MKLTTALKIAIAAAATASAVAIPNAPGANAATTPYCIDHNYVYLVSGGCDGLGGPGHDRMVINCRVDNSYYYETWYGPWHDRYSSWQENRTCGGGWYAWQVWFEHKNT